MRAREFESNLMTLGPWTRSALDQCTRQLREARMLPVGGRGLHAPDIDAEHAAIILLALGAADQASEMYTAVIGYAELVPVKATLDFLGNKNFVSTLTHILSSPEQTYGIAEVRINRTWPQATVVRMINGQTVVEEYRRADSPDTGYGRAAYVECVLRISLLSQLALRIKHPIVAGWTGDA